MSKNLIDWAELTKVWPCFEGMGLAPSSFDSLVKDVESPILIVGGGAGSNSKFLAERGYEVSAVDNCAEMVQLARAVRGVEIDLIDGEQLPFNDEAFRSVIVATGVVNAATLYTRGLWRLFSEATRVLCPAGTLTTAFFKQTPGLEYVFEHLRLAEVPSRNRHFIGCESLGEVRDRFMSDSDFDPALVSHIFSKHAAFLLQHLAHINRVTIRLNELGLDPSEFIRKHLSFDYYDMSSADAEYLASRLQTLLGVGELVRLLFEDTVSFAARKARKFGASSGVVDCEQAGSLAQGSNSSTTWADVAVGQ